MLLKAHRETKLRGLIIVNLALADLDNFKNKNEEMEKRLQACSTGSHLTCRVHTTRICVALCHVK